jgi:hypothetical protein
MRTREIESLFEEAPRVPWRPRRFLVALLALIVVAVIVTIAIVSRNGADALAELRVRDEGVSLIRGAAVPSEAAEGQDLRSGDVIRTDASGRAQVDFFDGSTLVRLDTDSELSLRKVEESSDGRNVALGLVRGRTWNHVASLGESDRFSVDLGEASVNVVGTSFLSDCTEEPVCYVVGFEGAAVVDSTAGRSVEAEEGDCVIVDREGLLERCDERKLGLIDDWVRENLALDQQLTFDRIGDQTPSPSPTPSRAPFVPRPAPGPVTAPTAAPTPTAEPEPTPTKRSLPKKTRKPHTPAPSDPTSPPTPIGDPLPTP